MHKDFGEEANRIINDLSATLEAKSIQLEDAWAEIRAKEEQFRVCFAHGGSPGFPGPHYCPKCIDEQINGLQADYHNACQQNVEQLALLDKYKGTLEEIASILPFSPADGFHCKQRAMRALGSV